MLAWPPKEHQAVSSLDFSNSAGNGLQNSNGSTHLNIFLSDLPRHSDMASDNRHSTRTSIFNEDYRGPSIGTHNQTLLIALQEFLVPLIRAVGDPEQLSNHNLLGPEAANLLWALKEFISSVVRTPELKFTAMLDVNEDKEEAALNKCHDVADRRMAMCTVPSGSNKQAIGDELTLIQFKLERPRTTFQAKVMGGLREHVFNKLPIRLLSFEKHNKNIRIELLERGAIFAQLQSKLQATMNEPWFRKKIMSSADHSNAAEDENRIKWLISKHAKYAILSHTWLDSTPGEVTYDEWMNGCFNPADPGYRKLVNFCNAAWTDHELTFGWMDTVCINKDSSSELDESIRSMYNWYQRAQVGIIFLAATEELSHMSYDPWFTRGWTLQELLAPEVIKFYNCSWKRFEPDSDNDKRDSEEIVHQIKKATTIARHELLYILQSPLSRRMQLAATRQVTREEDMAYSLVGIFDVSIATAYGEGAQRAFFRLLQEVLNSTSTGILDLFNCAGERPYYYSIPSSRLLPSNPQHYLYRNSYLDLQRMQPLQPLLLTPMGLRIPVLLRVGISISGRNSPYKSIGEYTAFVEILPNRRWYLIPHAYRLLDNRVGGPDGDLNGERHQYTFAVFNIGQGPQGISIPQSCIAIALECSEDAGAVTSMDIIDRVETYYPVVFDMEDKRGNKLPKEGVQIPADKLKTHGMQLISIYL